MFTEIQEKISHIRIQHTRNLFNNKSDNYNLAELDELEKQINYIKAEMRIAWIKQTIEKGIDMFSQDYLIPKLLYDFHKILEILYHNDSKTIIFQKINDIPNFNICKYL